jgi:hypothetical protein
VQPAVPRPAAATRVPPPPVAPRPPQPATPAGLAWSLDDADSDLIPLDDL